MEGYTIGQTWFEVIGTNIITYTLLGYVPNREIVILDIDGRGKRMEKVAFKEKELTLFAIMADAVIEKDANALTQLNDEIAFHEEERLRLIAEKDGTNN